MTTGRWLKMQVGSGSQVGTTITFPRAIPWRRYLKSWKKRYLPVEDLYEAAANYNYSYSFLEGMEPGEASRLEGYLFPDTYEFYQGMQASSAINKFLENFHYKLTADMYIQAENLGLSLNEVLAVASMIEKEAANDEERPVIASVIYNRLKAGMLLQIDATVQYALPSARRC